MKLAPVRQIVAIKAEGTYTRVYLAEGDSLIVLKPIGEWEFCLPAPPFLRLDRSLLVNQDAIREIHALSRDETRVGLKGMDDVLILGGLLRADCAAPWPSGDPTDRSPDSLNNRADSLNGAVQAMPTKIRHSA